MAKWFYLHSKSILKIYIRFKIFISPAGALIAGICFFLPWLEVSCVNRKITGAGIGSIAWGIPALCLIILLLFFYYYYNTNLKKSKPFIISGAITGIIIIGIIAFKFMQQIDVKYPDRSLQDLGIHIRYGILGTLGGLITSILGTLFLDDNSLLGKSSDETGNREIGKLPDNVEEITSPSDGQESQSP